MLLFLSSLLVMMEQTVPGCMCCDECDSYIGGLVERKKKVSSLAF